MGLLRRLKGSIEISLNKEALNEEVEGILDTLCDAMKHAPD
jgi:hypothetical protein